MSALLTTDALWLVLAGEFRAAVEAAVSSAFTTSVAPVPAGAGWSTPITASGRVEGTLTVWVDEAGVAAIAQAIICLLYTSPSPRDGLLSRMPSSA